MEMSVYYFPVHKPMNRYSLLFTVACSKHIKAKKLGGAWKRGYMIAIYVNGSLIPICCRKLGGAWERGYVNGALTVNALSEIWFPPPRISSTLSPGLPSIYICSKHTSLSNCYPSSTLFPAVVSINR